MTLVMKSMTGATTGHSFVFKFDEYERVEYAQATFDSPEIIDSVFAAAVGISGTTVTVTITKAQMSATHTWGNADAADLDDKKVVVVADCI